MLAGWSALYFGINFYILVEEQIDQMRDLEVQASSAQLAMLRYQLNPHFLFNTLNSISTLVLLKQTERANAMLSRLSSFLRYTLANEPTAHVTVAQEVETLKLYLEIEKMRFEERLRPKFDIDPAAERARLPSLLLQPLVENAIKYAVTPQEEGADICVEVRLAGERVQITVSDTGPGLRRRRNRPACPPASDWPISGSGWRRPMGRPAVRSTVRRRKGASRSRSTIPFQLEDVRQRSQHMTIRTILVDDEPLAIQGLELRLAAVRRRRDHRQVHQRARGDPRDQDAQARPGLSRHPDARVRRLFGRVRG